MLHAMSWLLRLILGLAMLVLLTSLSEYAMAETPVPQAVHSALHAMGPQAAHIIDLWRVFLFLCTLFLAAIVAAVVYVIWRAPRSGNDTPPDVALAHASEPGPRRNVTRAVAASIVGLLVLVIASVFTDRALARLPLADAVNIEVTAHQWWWTARYMNGGPSDIFVTANELHVPVGKPVVVSLKSDDVIHSLWIPNLAGKKDLIPGRSALLQFRADQPGIYRGQCAEFCGFQHALMGLLVVADPPEQYQAWVEAQRQPAAEPHDAKAERGKQLFQSVSCAMCHAIQGTQAQAQKGPDLTHVASRRTLAAGTLANTPQEMSSWISNPQVHKPGTSMPATPLSSEDLEALVAYLGGLK
jgi:cytochrome c oxidase subunit II